MRTSPLLRRDSAAARSPRPRRAIGQGTRTAPLAIQRSAEILIRNATSVGLQAAVDFMNEPSNEALPFGLNVTSGVSITVGEAEPGAHTNVPLTW